MNDPKISEPSDSLPIDQMTYEQAFTQLEKIVTELEAGDNSLDAALALFERGQALSRHCAALLDQAELKVQQIIGEDLIDFTPQ
jgi:exodeoxyribonuclease VII small subunit